MDFSGFNIWEILVAPLVSFLIGFLWYGKLLFGNTWKNLAGLSDDDIQSSNMLKIFLLTYLFNVFIAFFLSIFIEVAMMLGSSAIYGAIFATILAVGFVATTFGINYLFARKPIKLYLIDVGYMMVSFFCMGFIIGAWY